MKKVIPKKKDPFRVLSCEVDEFSSMSLGSSRSISASDPLFQSPSFQFPSTLSPSVSPNSFSRTSIKVETSIGVAGKKIRTGDMLMVNKDGFIVPFTGPEGRSNV